jgi:Zn-dependent peptidase ImmA (M78 family)/DNA-binding XRE family transcriptional regulator
MSDETFNPALLLLARHYKQLSQAEVAHAAGLAQGHYSRIENGIMPDGPSKETVTKIAHALDFPAEFFYEPDGPTGLPLSVHPAMERRKLGMRERDLRQIHAELNLRLIHIRRYLRAVDLEPELPLPEIDVDDGGGPREVARTVRRAWSIPDGPIANLTDCAERAGILIVHCSFSAPIDGVAMRVRGIPPCVFLNASVTADRMRFSLAHEIAHMVMHRLPTETMEKEANTFASELLVPERVFRRSVIGHRITLDWLARQKAYWKVSMGSILYLCGELGVLTRHQSEYLWKRLSALGWRTREPEVTDFPREEATVFPRIVRLHVDDLDYDQKALERLLRASAADVFKFYGEHLAPGGREGLRLVK